MRAPAALLATGLALLPAACVGPGPRPPALPATLGSTYADRDRDGTLEWAAGEPLVERRDLGAAGRPVRELARFAQISDAHVTDEESPARFGVLDRLGPPFNSTFRPQEALSAQVLAATVEALNATRPRAVVVTGDLIDNAQANELDLALTVLDGGRAAPDSGAVGYHGPQRAESRDPFFYRPDVDSPRRPGLLEAAQRSFSSPGLRAPWYPVLGNHDLLLGGELDPTRAGRRAATGGRRVAELPPGLPGPASGLRALADRVLEGEEVARSERTPADRARRLLSRGALLRRLRRASGHGGGGSSLDYRFDLGPSVRAIVLDLVRREGGSEGRLGSPQLAFLRRELRRAGRRWVLVFTHQPLERSQEGERALRLLTRHPRAVGVISGHTHRNRISARRGRGGLWLVGTASLADYPQQARSFRLLETTRGAVLETWMVDHGGGPAGAQAAVSRQLAYGDLQGGRPGRFRGASDDRNVRLHVPLAEAPGD